MKPWSTKQFLWGFGGWLLLIGAALFLMGLQVIGYDTGYLSGLAIGLALMQSIARVEAAKRGWDVEARP